MKVLIISVGGKPAGLRKSISAHQPTHVGFFCSQQSVELVPEIKRDLNVSFADKKFVVEDAEDINQCYVKALEAVAWAREVSSTQQDKAVERVVDVTGGTKVMSAALALAAGQGFAYSYVGGERADGIGTVLSGTERVMVSLGPQEFFAIEERQLIATAFNTYQFSLALHTLHSALGRDIEGAQKAVLTTLEKAIIAYREWDRFNHVDAIKLLDEALDEFRRILPLAHNSHLDAFTAELAVNKEHLARLQKSTLNFKRPHRLLVLDLIANAIRRAAEGKYDDAVARLYRSLEMAGQLEASSALGIESTGNVPASKIPESLRDEYIQRYKDPFDGRIRTPLYATYRMLEVVNNELGKRFAASRKRALSLLDVRNSSILAHGIRPVEEKVYPAFLQYVRELLAVEDPELPTFPKLELSF